MNIDDITPQQARVAFKGWDVKKQRKFLEGLLEEHAYCCGLMLAIDPEGDNGFRFEMTKKCAIALMEGNKHGKAQTPK